VTKMKNNRTIIFLAASN